MTDFVTLCMNGANASRYCDPYAGQVLRDGGADAHSAHHPRQGKLGQLLPLLVVVVIGIRSGSMVKTHKEAVEPD